MRGRRREVSEVEMQMGPMIDMVFLLLVFFMVTAQPLDPEKDIRMSLPGSVSQEKPVTFPDEQRIVIRDDGAVELNGRVFGVAASRRIPELEVTLTRFRLASDQNGAPSLVTIAPADPVPHQRVVDVLDACAAAGIHGISFRDEEAPGP